MAKKELACLLARVADVIVDRLTRRFGELEPDRLACLLLPNRRPFERLAGGRNVLDSERDHVAAAQLAVDREIEHREVANLAFDVKLGSDRPDVLRPKRRLLADKLALVPGLACR